MCIRDSAYGDDFFGSILVLGGMLGILTSWNGFFMGATRLLFAMGRAKMLPAVFGVVHPKYRTPWAATLLVGIVCIAAPLLGQNALLWFVDISSFCAVFAYCCVSVSYTHLEAVRCIVRAKKEHDRLESYYIPNMDFKKIDALRDETVSYTHLLMRILRF